MAADVGGGVGAPVMASISGYKGKPMLVGEKCRPGDGKRVMMTITNAPKLIGDGETTARRNGGRHLQKGKG